MKAFALLFPLLMVVVLTAPAVALADEPFEESPAAAQPAPAEESASAEPEGLQRGIDLVNSQEFAAAERELESIDGNAKAFLYLGKARAGQNKWSVAGEAFQRSEELEPSASAKLGLARVAVEQKQIDRAASFVSAAREQDADHDELPFLDGVVKVARRDFRPATEQLEKACRLDPRNAYAHYYAGLAYNGIKRQDKVAEHFGQFLKLAPNAPEAARVRALLNALH